MKRKNVYTCHFKLIFVMVRYLCFVDISRYQLVIYIFLKFQTQAFRRAKQGSSSTTTTSNEEDCEDGSCDEDGEEGEDVLGGKDGENSEDVATMAVIRPRISFENCLCCFS